MLTVVSLLLGPSVVDARAAREARAVGSAGHAAERRGVPDASQCDTDRGAKAYGSRERCLHAACAGKNVANAFVLDAAHRLQRNPCAGVDPFAGTR